jgi:hypothetical protein
MRWRVRALQGLEILEARDLAVAWGFPREIDEQELLLGAWFAFGEHMRFWFFESADLAKGEIGVHVAISPNHRGEGDRRDWLRTCVTLCDLMRKDTLICVPLTQEISHIAEQQGFTRRGERWEYSLRGDGDGGHRQVGAEAEPHELHH